VGSGWRVDGTGVVASHEGDWLLFGVFVVGVGILHLR
jgi:hypothetical protein